MDYASELDSRDAHYYNLGYKHGYDRALTTAQRDISTDLGTPKPKRRKRNPWVMFLKKFSYRKRRRNETAQAYLSQRTRAAGRAWKRSKK